MIVSQLKKEIEYYKDLKGAYAGYEYANFEEVEMKLRAFYYLQTVEYHNNENIENVDNILKEWGIK